MMRKLVLAIVALFSLSSAAYAAFAIFQTAITATPQITCNISTGVASVGGPCASPAATCNGDVQRVTRTVSITSGTAILTASTNTWTPADAGKVIWVPGAASSGGILITTILASPTPTVTQVTVANNAGTTLTAISKDLIFGTDDAPAFGQFNVWALANQASNQVVMNFTAASSCWFGTQAGGGFIKWLAGIKDLVVEGNSSTLDAINIPFYVGSTAGAICAKGLTDGSGCTARINTVSAGATQIQLTAASLAAGYISRFSAVAGANGNWILVSGLNPQEVPGGGSGYPPNPTYFDWRRITAINVGTGVIDLDAPLTYDYLDTWPTYSTGTGVDSDPGGPATIYAMNDAWNTTLEFKNLTMMQTGQQNGNGKNVTYRNVSFNGSIPSAGVNNCGATPSQNLNWSAYTVDWTYCTIETDKITTNLVLDAVTSNRIDFQSSSIINLTMSNSTVASMFGTPRFSALTDVTITTAFRPGATAYGLSTQLVCTRCNVTGFDGSGGIAQSTLGIFSKVGSVLQVLNSDVTNANGPPTKIFAPVGISDSNLMYVVGGSFSGTIGMMNVSALTQDATNTYAQTSDTVAFPPPFTSASGAACCANLATHPAPKFTCDACTGDAIFASMNIQGGATPLAPLGESAFRSYNPSAAVTNAGTLFSRGRLVSLTIDVTTASTHAGASTVIPTTNGNLETVKQSTWTPFAWGPTINLKQTGTRVITPGGVTCNGGAGGCAGDTINSTNGFPPEAVWIKGGLFPQVTGSFGGGVDPVFTITAKTDQGVVP